MCLLIMVSRLYESAPLVVGANRDERLERPATAITILQGSGPRILGGRDELAGGTWLAVNDQGLVAALTNRPSPGGRDASKRSRGELPLALAQHSKSENAVEDFVDRFDPSSYNPSSLLVGDRRSLFSIDMTGEAPRVSELPPGLHVLENLPLGHPSAKVENVRRLMGTPRAGSSRTDALLEQLRRVLSDHSQPQGLEEPVATSTETFERDRETLAACVHTDSYGTRSSTIVCVPSSEDELISVSVADGNPCSTPFSDASPLWKA